MKKELARIKALSIDGRIISESRYNGSRPDGYASGGTVRAKLGMRWAEIASMLGLSSFNSSRSDKKVGRNKRCTCCGNEKDYSQFHRNRSNTDGHSFRCKVCVGEQRKARSRAKFRASTEQVMQAIRGMSNDGTMPTIAFWNKNRPEGYPGASTIRNRTGKTWGELADELGLSIAWNRNPAISEDEKRELAILAQLEIEQTERKPVVRPRDDIQFVNNDFFVDTFRPSIRGMR